MLQKKHGTNYEHWPHPLSPRYCKKPGDDLLTVHPKSGQGKLPQLAGIDLRSG